MRAGRLAVLAMLVGAWGCENELPTLTGDGVFPADRIPVTIELTIPSDQVVRSEAVHEGFDTPLAYLLVANTFDGVLTSHAIARYSGFPDSVRYAVGGTFHTERQFAYVGGVLIGVVDTLSSVRELTRLEAHGVAQAWDTLAVSWENAVNRPGATVPWTVPGGTVGPVAGAAEWTGGAGETDTVRIPLDSLTVRRLASGELHGVQVRTPTAGRRLELSRLDLEVSIRPAGHPDTILTEPVFGGRRTFVVTPDPPQQGGVLRVGGLAGARVALELILDQQVPTCPPPQTGPGCPTVPLREVTLDRASLVLRAAGVPAGFRPLTPSLLQARRLAEPELGPRAPIGALLFSQDVPADRFSGGAAAAEVAVDLTSSVAVTLATPPHRLAIVLVSPIGTNDFGTAWFESAPTLRVIYTVPRAPRFP